MTKTIVKDDFDSANEVPSNWVKWNTVGDDKIFGTLMRKMKGENAYKPGEMVENYEIKADYGSFHNVDEKKNLIETPITINLGEIWSVGGKDGIAKQMANVKIGQKLGFKYIDEKVSRTKGHQPAKLIKVFTPKNDDGSYKMDEEWLAQDDMASAIKDF